jgi:hypothetical protein
MQKKLLTAAISYAPSLPLALHSATLHPNADLPIIRQNVG